MLNAITQLVKVLNDVFPVAAVLGTVDQLIIDRCIMEEVKQYHRNLAVAFYDYKKTYHKVHHGWILRVYEWICISKKSNRIDLSTDEQVEHETRNMERRRESYQHMD